MVKVDDVYQKVLALANKEQRGYITPQEFNLFADHAQMEIFEQYFYDLERAVKTGPSDTEFTDKATNLDEKISLFERYDTVAAINQDGDILFTGLNIYRLGTVRLDFASTGVGWVNAEQMDMKELYKYNTPLTVSGKLAGPYFLKYYAGNHELRIKTIPPIGPEDSGSVSYVEKPSVPNWTYFVSPGGAALYNPSALDHSNFQLHASEENNLVVKILQLAGISIKDYQLTGLAAQAEGKKIQQENQ